MSLPIYKAKIKSNEDVMDFMGFVEVPAHGKEMRFFNTETKRPKQVFNDERQIVTGVAISTNQPIYRNDPTGEYYMFFDKQTTRELGRRLLENNFGGNVNINHDHSNIVKSARIDEIFYVDKKRGIEAPSEFASQNLQDGSMLISYHIADKKEFQELKKKNLSGFSIEVFIDVERTKFQKANQKSKIKMKNKNKGFFDKVKALFDEEVEEQEKTFAEATTVDGANLKWEGELVENETAIYIVSEEEEILAPEGVHVIAEGEKQIMLTVGADGILTNVEEATEEAPEEMSGIEKTLELMAKQVVKLKTDKDELSEVVKGFEKRFSNIESKLDVEKKEAKVNKFKSIGKAIKS